VINDARSRLTTVYCLESINNYPVTKSLDLRQQITLYRMNMILLHSIDESVVAANITEYLENIDDDVIALAVGNNCPICNENNLDFDVQNPLNSTCTHSLTHLLTHSLTHLLTHSLTYSLTKVTFVKSIFHVVCIHLN